MTSIRAAGPSIALSSTDRFTPSPLPQETPFQLEDRLELSAERAAEIEAGLGDRVARQLLVKLPSDTSPEQLKSLAQDYGASISKEVEIPQVMREKFNGQLVLMELGAGISEAQALAAMELDSRVLLADTNDQMKLTRTPNDLDPEQWNLKNEGRFGVVGADIDAERAWDITTGNRENGPIVAVLDSGIDLGHLDIRANLWRNTGEVHNGIDDDRNGIVDDLHGVDPKKDNGNIVDHLGHGTHVAGIIGAVGDNDRGVTGVNWATRMMGIKIADGVGRVSTVGAIFGTLYASENGAKIANNSWGGPVHNSILEDIMRSSPMLHVCAAGNGQSDNDARPFYPASYEMENIISVGASTKRDVALFLSNWGATSVDVHAPGALVYSTLPQNNYDFESGTSMAAPHVSGVAALIATQYPEASIEEIKNRIVYSSDPIDDMHGKSVSGGRLNAFNALQQDEVAPGEIGDLQMTSVTADGFEVAWTAPGDDGAEGQAKHYELMVELDGQKRRLVTDRPAQPGSRETAVFRDVPLNQERNVKLSLRALDEIGNSSPVAPMAATLPAATTVLFDDAENDLGWETDTWGRVEEPGRGLVWTETPDGDFEDSTDYDMVSPSFDLSKSRSTQLSFDAKLEAPKWDFLWVAASKDGGENFDFLGVVRGEGPIDWDTYRMDLSQFDGETDVKLRFRFRSSNADTGDGVYLDNIRVMGAEVAIDPKRNSPGA